MYFDFCQLLYTAIADIKNFRLMAADDSRAKRCSAGEKMLEEDPLGDIAVLTTICQQPPAAAIVHPHACL